MPTLTAELYTDQDLFPFEAELTELGGRVLASYIVNSSNVAEVARQAVAGTIAGAPKLGDAWDAVNFPGVLCRRIVPVRIGGVDDAEGVGGHTSLQCTFQSPSVSGRIAGAAGQKFAVVEATAVAIVKSYEVDEDGVPNTGGEIINNRQGVSADVRIRTFKISVFYDRSEFDEYDWDRLDELQMEGPTNSDPVEIPAPPGFDGASFGTFAPGRLRYQEHRLIDGAPGSFGIEHTVLCAVDHHARWIPEDENGNASGPRVTKRIWPSAPFAGLW